MSHASSISSPKHLLRAMTVEKAKCANDVLYPSIETTLQ
jgi:hypothetical protein